MDKIVIIGSPGAGKSTLARQLGAILEIEVIHLDRYFWEPEWKEKPKEVRRKILQEFVQKDQWIIEGTYLDTSNIHLHAADTIIFLDVPNWLCFWRVLKRYFKYRRESRPDLPEGCPEKLRLLYILKILGFPLFKRKGLFSRFSEFGYEKRVDRLSSNSDIERYLRELRQAKEEHTLENTYSSESNRSVDKS